MMTDRDERTESTRRTFLQRSAPWSPAVGDAVVIKDCDLAGTVMQTKGVYETRFRVSVTSSAVGLGRQAADERRAARRASRWYGLDELKPPS
jgi:hypothetical protein